MILANGMLWTYWITVCVPRAIILSSKLFLGDYLFLSLVQTGWLLSTIAVVIIFSQFKKLLSNPKVIPIIFKIFALIFIYFAVDTFIKTILFFSFLNFNVPPVY
jgi:threonine/homoserine/homoserine lactone efflux protein